MHYLSFIRQSLTAKNNLEKAVAVYLNSQNRKIIPEAEKEAFKKQVVADILKHNASYKRCTALKPVWSSSGRLDENKDEHLQGIPFSSFVLYGGRQTGTPPPAEPAAAKKAETTPAPQAADTITRDRFDV